jgi:hypothetical protein
MSHYDKVTYSKEASSKITHRMVRNYLIAKDWNLFSESSSTLCYQKTDDSQYIVAVTLITDLSYGDYYRRLTEVIHSIGYLEQRHVWDIVIDIHQLQNEFSLSDFTISSGNVFEDLKVSDAERHSEKANILSAKFASKIK